MIIGAEPRPIEQSTPASYTHNATKEPATAAPVPILEPAPCNHGSFTNNLTPSPTNCRSPNHPHYEGPDRRWPEPSTLRSSAVSKLPSTKPTKRSSTTHMITSLAIWQQHAAHRTCQNRHPSKRQYPKRRPSHCRRQPRMEDPHPEGQQCQPAHPESAELRQKEDARNAQAHRIPGLEKGHTHQAADYAEGRTEDGMHRERTMSPA